MTQEHDQPPRAHADRAPRAGTPTGTGDYRVLLSAPEAGFELAEHRLSKQLLFVLSQRPALDLAGELEAAGFDHTDDERLFTLDATAPGRRQAMRIAEKYSRECGQGR